MKCFKTRVMLAIVFSLLWINSSAQAMYRKPEQAEQILKFVVHLEGVERVKEILHRFPEFAKESYSLGVLVDDKTFLRIAHANRKKSGKSRKHISKINMPCAKFSLDAPLRLAAKLGRISLIDILIELKADINLAVAPITQCDFKKATPLQTAAAHGQTQFADLLIKANAQIHSVDLEGKNALMRAVENGHRETVALLLSAKASPHQQSIAGDYALNLAAKLPKTDIIELLLDHGADPNRGNNQDQTPFLAAAQFRNAPALRVLLPITKEPTRVDQQGRSALDLAVGMNLAAEEYSNVGEAIIAFALGKNPILDGGWRDTVTYLIKETKADVNASNREDQSILHHLAWQLQEGPYVHYTMAMFKQVIQAGGDIHKANVVGETPLAIAERFATPDIKLFLEWALAGFPDSKTHNSFSHCPLNISNRSMDICACFPLEQVFLPTIAVRAGNAQVLAALLDREEQSSEEEGFVRIAQQLHDPKIMAVLQDYGLVYEESVEGNDDSFTTDPSTEESQSDSQSVDEQLPEKGYES